MVRILSREPVVLIEALVDFHPDIMDSTMVVSELRDLFSELLDLTLTSHLAMESRVS
jgi:hypothetical protein